MDSSAFFYKMISLNKVLSLKISNSCDKVEFRTMSENRYFRK